MLAKLTTKNQLTLPREIVKEFKGIEYFDANVLDGRIVLAPVRMQPVDANLEGIRKKMEKLGITPGDVAEAVRWARRNEK
ncbi:MAG: AbrB/MazE/SpoVT family DNA-binding domain-containing protein [Deltaproteobacteria bacterium]|nr:AbrB/MazE/SpoVT family DNA-binding domain-containing protein [Deltaproteobacteria bacterium]